ncbi:hypothetical protein AAII07_56780 [Microvirga sp. 0TCS3.31]
MSSIQAVCMAWLPPITTAMARIIEMRNAMLIHAKRSARFIAWTISAGSCGRVSLTSLPLPP